MCVSVCVSEDMSCSGAGPDGGTTEGGSGAQIKSLRGFASLSGALLQLRIVSKQLSLSVFAERSIHDADNEQKRSMIAQYNELMVGRSSAKGSMLVSGLPAYPISAGLRSTSSGSSANLDSISRLSTKLSDISDSSKVRQGEKGEGR
jgi:hypothetical protein